MRIKIVDKQVKHVLKLTSEEVVALLRFQPPSTNRVPTRVSSPCLVIANGNKYEVDILSVQDRGGTWSGSNDDSDDYDVDNDNAVRDFSSRRRKAKWSDPAQKVPPFSITVEMPEGMFEDLVKSESTILLIRVQNIPAYSVVGSISVSFDKPGSKPKLVINVSAVKTVADLMRTQITESTFYENFILGRSNEFFDSVGADLDAIVKLVGMCRKPDETDVELRNRVKDYLRLKIAGTTDVDDDIVADLIREAEEKEEIEQAMREAKKRLDKKQKCE